MEVIKAKPTIKNLSMPTANTTYSYQIPDEARYFKVRLRNIESTGKIGVADELGTNYFTIKQGISLKQEIKAGGSTIYLRSDNNNDTAEIISWN